MPTDKKNIFKWIKLGIQLLSIIATVVLILSYIIIRGSALNFINEFDKELALIEKTSFVFDVKMEQNIPFDMSIPLSEIMDINQLIPDSIHINDTIPVNMTIPISQNVTATINIPLSGNTQITIPINAQIPVSTQVSIDDDINIENAEIKDQQVTIKDEIPVSLNFKVKKSIADLGLTQHIKQTHSVLNSLRLFFFSKPRDLSEYDIQTEEVKAIEIVIE